MRQKTTWINKDNVERKWYFIDAKDAILGRLSTVAANKLMGKDKVARVPNVDCGDYLIVLNSDKVKLSSDKGGKKTYFRHSGYPGGAKTITFDKQIQKDSTFVIRHAINNMLPNNKLRASMLTRLFIFKDTKHKHSAQNPVEIKLSEK